MKKRVGLSIVTYGTNYGTYLQAFATQCFIRKLGYDTEIINIDSVKSEVHSARKKYFVRQLINFPEVKSYFPVIKGLVCEKTNKNYRAYINCRKKQFEIFRNKYFYFSEVRKSWQGLRDLCEEKYDHVVVGSDQLWRPANIEGNFYTLNFVPEHINKIAYATSFGLGEIRRDQRDKTKQFLSRIQHLSVRENSGSRIIDELIGRKVPVVCDPTLLLKKDEWNKFIDDKPIINKHYILCYFLGNNKKHRAFAKALAEKTGCVIVGVLHVAGYLSIDKDFADIVPEEIGPFEFLNLIKNAQYVCTDSFHGCVFSAIFNKPLFAFRRFKSNSKMSTNDRITTLLSGLNLSNALIEGTELIDNLLNIAIDYKSVEELLLKKRDEGISYLNCAFNEEDNDKK